MGAHPIHTSVELPLGLAADHCGLTRLQLRELIEAGTVRARQAGGYLYVNMDSLAAMQARLADGRSTGEVKRE